VSACGKFALLSSSYYFLVFQIRDRIELSLIRQIKCVSNIQVGSFDTSLERISVAVLLEDDRVLFAEFEKGGGILPCNYRKLKRSASSITVDSEQRAVACGNALGIELHLNFNVTTYKYNF